MVSLKNETPRREALFLPLLLEVITHCQFQLEIEYTVNINNWLNVNLDYLLRSHQNLLVIKAENDDSSRGFTQLAVELIALSAGIGENKSMFYAPITSGEVQCSGKLERQQKQIALDITLSTIPDNFEEITHIFSWNFGGRITIDRYYLVPVIQELSLLWFGFL